MIDSTQDQLAAKRTVSVRNRSLESFLSIMGMQVSSDV